MCGVFMFNIFTAISQLTVLKRIYEWGYIYIINKSVLEVFFLSLHYCTHIIINIVLFFKCL